MLYDLSIVKYKHIVRLPSNEIHIRQQRISTDDVDIVAQNDRGKIASGLRRYFQICRFFCMQTIAMHLSSKQNSQYYYLFENSKKEKL